MNSDILGTQNPFNDYSSYVRRIFGERVQKISIDAGFTCPNRDGSKGRGGCTYCNNGAFVPDFYRQTKPIIDQLTRGISFFSEKYKAQKYLAYFQSYTNTYQDVEKLKEMYESALSHSDVIGLVISTRPDCVTEEILDMIAELSKKCFVSIEYGIESTKDETLLAINRGHSYSETVKAIELTASKGINTGGHLILGLPGETKADMLHHISEVSKLPLKTIKFHQLQIIKGTVMHDQYQKTPEMFHLFETQEYIELVMDVLDQLNPNITIERFVAEAPKELLVAPQWGLKNFEFNNKLISSLKKSGKYQGRLYNV